MSVRDLIPWSRAAAPKSRDADQHPFMTLHRDINRLFDDAFRGFDLPTVFGRDGFARDVFERAPFGAGWPSVEVSETEKEIRLTAEVPGLAEKDVEVLLEGDVLTLRGEKKAETEDKDRHFSERYYGRFERRMNVGPDIDREKVEASFKNGVLTVALPKTENAKSASKRIPIAAR